MVKFFQNRELAQKLGVNLAKWKRWSREFLPPDPLGGLQSGYARQYNLDDAFTVYLGGYLVSELKFSIPEAKQIVSDLKEWMISHRFYYYYDHINGKNNPVDMPIDHFRIHICLSRYQDIKPYQIIYRIKRVIANGATTLNGEGIVVEQTVEEPIDTDSKSSENNTAADDLFRGWGARVVYLTELYHHFLELLELTWIVEG